MILEALLRPDEEVAHGQTVAKPFSFFLHTALFSSLSPYPFQPLGFNSLDMEKHSYSNIPPQLASDCVGCLLKLYKVASIVCTNCQQKHDVSQISCVPR